LHSAPLNHSHYSFPRLHHPSCTLKYTSIQNVPFSRPISPPTSKPFPIPNATNNDAWWEAYLDDDPNALGPAAQATLDMLDWKELCRQVSSFAQTYLGKQAIQSMLPTTTREACREALLQSQAAHALLFELATDIDFGGVSTESASKALNRADKGGMLDGPSLQSLASLLACATKLKRAISTAAREAERTGYTAVQPISSPFSSLSALPELISEISYAIEESGKVRESASEKVKQTRNKVRILEARIRSILKSKVASGGEVTEKNGRICLAAPVTPEGPPKGMVLLGSAAGTMYLESPAVVPINNELAGARGEAAAAEEAVLWQLTGRVQDCASLLRATLNVIIWLDGLVAKAKYGQWIGGSLPEIIPIPRFIRSNKKNRKKNKGEREWEEEEEEEEGQDDSIDDDASSSSSYDDHYVYMKRLRNPLLLGAYLEKKQEMQSSSSGSSRNRRGGGKRLPGWVVGDDSASEGEDMEVSSSSSSNGTASGTTITPPVAIDMTVSNTTRAIVITGPNTGGKTATLRALGLSALSARCGLPIPASPPIRLPFFDAVLADIGDEQSLSASLSTFSGHLVRIEGLRKEATGKSLVLLDELGTGTDPIEGSALGIALMKALVGGGSGSGSKSGGGEGEGSGGNQEKETGSPSSPSSSSHTWGVAALTVATTHHSALAELKFKDDRFENASVEFDDIKLQPTYRLQWGVPGRSNALNIAERLGLDADVVVAAREMLGAGVAGVNDAIVELEGERKRGEKEEGRGEEAMRMAREADLAYATLR
jgi:dsDNA-specific endonuclease/ATPase MutS2